MTAIEKTLINSNTNIVKDILIVENSFTADDGFYLGPAGGKPGMLYNKTTKLFSTGPKTPDEIVELQSKKILKAFAFMHQKLQEAVATVPIDGTNYPFSCDEIGQQNIIGVNAAIGVGIVIPEPIYWTPKGYPYPIVVTTNDLKNIGGAILLKKNELYATYFYHKGSILMTSNYDEINSYDYTVGY